MISGVLTLHIVNKLSFGSDGYSIQRNDKIKFNSLKLLHIGGCIIYQFSSAL